MKAFLTKTGLFAIPVIVTVCCLELYIRVSPNAFSFKARHFRSQNDYGVIALGSSHTQTGINPKFFSSPGANLAYGSQDLKLDVKLLEMAIATNRKPKVLLLEMSYHRLLRENPENYWRNGLYENYYGLRLSKGFSVSKYLLIGTNLKFFRNFVVSSALRKTDGAQVNAWGFDENDFAGPFRSLGYDSIKIASTSPKRVSIDGWGKGDAETIRRNVACLQRISELCTANNIRLVLLTPPVFATYSRWYKDHIVALREETVALLRKENPSVAWLNFENDPRFTLKHFKNDDHLNSDGAKLLTMLTDRFLAEPWLTSR